MQYTVATHPVSGAVAVIAPNGDIHTITGSGVEAMSRALDLRDKLNAKLRKG